MSKRWGTPTWYFLHTLIEKILDRDYPKIYQEFNSVFNGIIYALPCPICKNHSIQYLKNNPINNIKTKSKMKMYIFHFHNWVNKKLNKKQYGTDILDFYDKLDIRKVHKYFMREFFKTNLLRKQFFLWQNQFLEEKINKFLYKNTASIRI